MFASAGRAAAALFRREFAGLLAQAFLFALVVFVALAALVWWLTDSFLPTLGWEWVNAALEIVAPLLTFFLIFFLGAPVAALYVGVFLERVADRIEALDYPADPPARGVGIATSLASGVGLAAAVVALNLVALPVNLIPVLGTLAVLAVNAHLLGREFFELVALRHRTRSQVKALRRAHRGAVFGAGLIVAALTLVPVLNLVAPLFATIFMVHLYKRIARDAAF